MSKFISLLLLVVFVSSCDEKKTIYVAPFLASCDENSEKKCLLIKESVNDEWKQFSGAIEGFDYKEGYTYKVEVNISKVKKPAADGTDLKYKLEKLIYQEPTTTKNELAEIPSGTWKVEVIPGLDSLAVQPTLTFKDGKVSGNAGCNNYSSSFTTNGDSISFGLAMATKMYCTNMSVEKAFFECLQKAKSYTLNKGNLVIYDDAKNQLLSCQTVED